MENGMQTMIRGASQLKVTRSRMAPGSSAGTGGRRTSRLPVEAVQPPYHLFRRDIEAGLLPYAAAYHIGVLAYGPLARGLLGGTITEATTSGPGDWRSHSPALTGPGIRRNLNPAHRPQRRSPAQARSQGHSSASAASRPTALYFSEVDTCKSKAYRSSYEALRAHMRHRQSPGRRRRTVEPADRPGADFRPAPLPRPRRRPAGHPQQRPGRTAEGPAGLRRDHPAHPPGTRRRDRV